MKLGINLTFRMLNISVYLLVRFSPTSKLHRTPKMDIDTSSKRKASSTDDASDKRQKTKKQWRVPHSNNSKHADHERSRTIQPGDAGIWATCTKGKERKCIAELRDLFTDYAEVMYGGQMPVINDATTNSSTGEGDGNTTTEAAQSPDADDIESSIQTELATLRRAPTTGAAALFEPILPDMQCVVFFRVRQPIEPVAFVERIMRDAAAEPARKRTRFTQRLSPMSLMGRASEEGLERVAMEVLRSVFRHGESGAGEVGKGRRFAIRPTIRNHHVLGRDFVIQKVAACVGPGHVVDLKGYEVLILVEVYKVSLALFLFLKPLASAFFRLLLL